MFYKVLALGQEKVGGVFVSTIRSFLFYDTVVLVCFTSKHVVLTKCWNKSTVLQPSP